MDRAARLVLHRTVPRNAQVEESPGVYGIEAASVRAKLRSHREVERELGDDGGFQAAAVADGIERVSEIVDVQLHGVISAVVMSDKCDHGPAQRQSRSSARCCSTVT